MTRLRAAASAVGKLLFSCYASVRQAGSRNDLNRAYRAIRGLVWLLLSAFFRRIEVSGLEHVPVTGGGIIVAWHPNALVDPALIFTTFPRRIAFGARHAIFGWPIIGRAARAIGAVPIYRAADLGDSMSEDARREANRKSLESMTRAVVSGNFTALFPEGLSHDDPSPRALRPGAARLYYQAVRETPPAGTPPVLLPVGLHYDDKKLFGSGVVIIYHPPLELDPMLAEPPPLQAGEDERRARYVALTQEVESTLKNIVHATDKWEINYLLHRARKLVRAERAARAGARLPPPSMVERVLAFRRLWTGYNELRATRPDEVQRLLARIRRYDTELEALGLDDHELDAPPGNSKLLGDIVLALCALFAYLVMPPVLVVGYLVNAPPALGVWAIAKWRSRADKDEATIKMLAGLVAFPLAWLVASVAMVAAVVRFGRLSDIWSPGGSMLAAAAFGLCALGALLTVHYQRFAIRTLGRLRLRATHAYQAPSLQRLRAERSALCDDMLRLAGDLDLPGQVLPDGRILDERTL